jgi:hypothetical protein
MRPFIDWLRAGARVDRPWLILGKGPTFAKLASFGPHGYSTLGLNHVVRETRSTWRTRSTSK